MTILGEISITGKMIDADEYIYCVGFQLKKAKVTCNQIMQNVIGHGEIFLYLKEIHIKDILSSNA